jgi:type IV pilus assembly protein PilE
VTISRLGAFLRFQKVHKSAGFTLIELMIAVAIIVILMSIAYPSYLNQIRAARRADAMSALLKCAAQQARYYGSRVPPSYMTTTVANTNSLCQATDENYYNIALANSNCATTVSGTTYYTCFTATASPVSGGGQSEDSDCATFSITHTGLKSSLGSASQDTTSKCWKN